MLRHQLITLSLLMCVQASALEITEALKGASLAAQSTAVEVLSAAGRAMQVEKIKAIEEEIRFSKEWEKALEKQGLTAAAEEEKKKRKALQEEKSLREAQMNADTQIRDSASNRTDTLRRNGTPLNEKIGELKRDLKAEKQNIGEEASSYDLQNFKSKKDAIDGLRNTQKEINSLNEAAEQITHYNAQDPEDAIRLRNLADAKAAQASSNPESLAYQEPVGHTKAIITASGRTFEGKPLLEWSNQQEGVPGLQVGEKVFSTENYLDDLQKGIVPSSSELFRIQPDGTLKNFGTGQTIETQTFGGNTPLPKPSPEFGVPTAEEVYRSALARSSSSLTTAAKRIENLTKKPMPYFPRIRKITTVIPKWITSIPLSKRRSIASHTSSISRDEMQIINSATTSSARIPQANQANSD